MKKIKIMTVCGFGIGSSLLLKMKIEKILKAVNIDAEVFCNDVTTAAATDCDIIFTSKELAGQLTHIQKPQVTIGNFLDDNEIREKGLDAVKKLSAD